MGMRLMVRDRTGVTLTRQGATLYKKLKIWSNQWRAIHKEIQEGQLTVTGRFVFGCHSTLGQNDLPQVFLKLLNEFPELDLEAIHNTSQIITHEVNSLKIDFGIVVNAIPYPGLVIREIRKESSGLWSASHSWKVVFYNPDMIGIDGILGSLEKKTSSGRLRLVAINDYEVIEQMARKGCGAAILPNHIARKRHEIALKEIIPQPRRESYRICFIYRPDYQCSYAARKVISTVLAELK